MNRLSTALELNQRNVPDGKRATKQHEGVYPFYANNIKARSLEINCVSLLDIKFHGFSSAKLHQ